MSLSPARTRLYGLALFVVGLALFPAALNFVIAGNLFDWQVFWTAASTVGTRSLLDPAAHAAWGRAHDVSSAPFVYLPAAAWLLAPASHLSLGSGFVANAVTMLVIGGMAGVLAAKTYRLEIEFAVLSVLAWAPATAAIVTGQNSLLGLLLTLLAIFGLTRERVWLTGLAVGMLLYKPTYAIPLVLLLIVFRRWPALIIVCVSGGVWYLLSVSATGGDWAWPVTYMHVIAKYAGPDSAFNAAKVVSIPGTLLRFGLPLHVAYAVGAALLLGSAVLLARVPVLEAASIIPLLGLAASPHALEYDVVLALPSIFYAVKRLQEPWRTRSICGAYLCAPLWQYSVQYLGFDILAVIVIGAAVGWCVLRTSGLLSHPRTHVRLSLPASELSGSDATSRSSGRLTRVS